MIFILPITQKEAFYLREKGYKDCVQRTINKKSYYVVEQEDKVEKNKYGKVVKLLKYGALSVLKQYRDSLITHSYFK